MGASNTPISNPRETRPQVEYPAMTPPPAGYSPQEERFDRRTAGKPYLAAVQELCAHAGKSLEQMEQLSLNEIFELAEATYGENLPSFWQTWRDWHDDDEVQPMGDLDR